MEQENRLWGRAPSSVTHRHCLLVVCLPILKCFKTWSIEEVSRLPWKFLRLLQGFLRLLEDFSKNCWITLRAGNRQLPVAVALFILRCDCCFHQQRLGKSACVCSSKQTISVPQMEANNEIVSEIRIAYFPTNVCVGKIIKLSNWFQ